MQVLLPHVACLIGPGVKGDENSPLQQAIAEGYQQIYIQTDKGILLHRVLRPGRNGLHRFVRTPVVGNMASGKAVETIEPGMNFLPDGKISIELLDQVKAFFRQVIEKKGQKLEAMIWILWNETQGYHLHVPTQVVGHASAKYDWDSVPADSIIVVDIHSHADFNAFFSPTDNNDDKNSIRFSAVIGHNAPGQERSYKARFNYLGSYQELDINSLFKQPDRPEATVPDNWFDNVTLFTPPVVTKYYNQTGHQGYTGGSYTGGRMDGSGRFSGFPHTQGMTMSHTGSTRGNPGAAEQGEEVGGSRTVSKKPGSSFSEKLLDTNQVAAEEEDSIFFSRTMSQLSVGQSICFKNRWYRKTETGMILVPNYQSPSQLLSERDAGEGHEGGVAPAKSGSVAPAALSHFPTDAEDRVHRHGQAALDFGGAASQQERDLEQQAHEFFESLSRTHRTVIPTVSDDSGEESEGESRSSDTETRLAKGEVVQGSSGDSLLHDFDAVAINHGVGAARALEAIENASVELVSNPLLLRRANLEMFELLDDDDKLKLIKELADALPSKQRNILETYGL